MRGDLSKPCATFDGAYLKAQCGDLVQIAAGSYPAQQFSAPTKSCNGRYVVYRPAQGASVSVASVEADEGGPGWIELNGFASTSITIRDVANWRVIGVNGGSFDLNGSNIYLHGNDWGPCNSNGPEPICTQNFLGSHDANVLIDGDTFHDYNITPNSGAHFECVYDTGTTGSTTIQNSRFYGCTTYDIYFTGWDSSIHYYNGQTTLQNNWFGRSCNDAACTVPRSSAINFGAHDIGGVKNILIRDNSFADNQRIVDESHDNIASNVRATSNIFGASGCLDGISYSLNLFPSGTCSPQDRTGPPFGYVLKGAQLVLDKRRAEAVRTVFRAAAGGADPQSILRVLRKARLSKPKGGWTGQAIRDLLSDRDYLGHSIGWPPSHPALVSKRIWRRAQRALH